MRVNAFIKAMLQWSTTPSELFMLGSAATHWKGVQGFLPNSCWAQSFATLYIEHNC
jgi:hypothetical protein